MSAEAVARRDPRLIDMLLERFVYQSLAASRTERAVLVYTPLLVMSMLEVGDEVVVVEGDSGGHAMSRGEDVLCVSSSSCVIIRIITITIIITIIILIIIITTITHVLQ